MRNLLDNLGGLEQHVRGDGEAQRLGGLEVEDQFELRGLFYRQVRRLGASQDTIYIRGGTHDPILNHHFLTVDESLCVGRNVCTATKIDTTAFTAMDRTRNVIIEASSLSGAQVGP